MIKLKNIALICVAILLIMGPITGITATDIEVQGNSNYFTTGEVYWWKSVANPDEEVKKIMRDIAEMNKISFCEAKERFYELFPGVDLWGMSLGEFYYFVGNLPRKPIKVTCLEKERQQSHVMAVFGKTPELSTEYEIKKFDEKLLNIIQDIPSSVWDSILANNLSLSGNRNPEVNIPVIMTGANHGVITIGLPNQDLSVTKEVYDIISEKAKNLYEIADVPVVFWGGVSVSFTTWTPLPPYSE